MIFRQSAGETGSTSERSGVRPAFQVFVEAQQKTHTPAAVILQADHAKLAGAIAKCLRSDVFGELPQDVIRAIADHGCGWEQSDRSQLEHRDRQPLRPFPRLSVEETLPAWHASVRLALDDSMLKGVIVSRHFCALAGADPARQPFLDEENARREQLESRLAIAPELIDRWTAAIGFCDLVSLCLCSGIQEPVALALDHPALPGSRNAPRVVLQQVQGQPRFSSPIMEQSASVRVAGYEPQNSRAEFRCIEIEWQFP